MPRFVVLRHETPPGYPRPTHYDLMLEWGLALRTWALAEWPLASGLVAEELPPHRREYLDYEGEVTAGRGSVARVATGDFQVLDEQPDLLRVRVVSPTLAGTLEMARHLPSGATWTVVLKLEPNEHDRRGPEMLDTRRQT
jgi:hypothetical protein